MNPTSDASTVPGSAADAYAFPGSSDRPVRPRALKPEDADAVETVLARRLAGLKTGPVAPGSGERVEQAARVLGMMEAYPVEDPPADLVDRTLASVHAAKQRERFQQQVEMLTRPAPSLGLGWGQVAAAAAIFLVAAALLMPVLERNRNESMRAMAAANLGTASKALGSYAMVYGDVLPRRQTRAGDPWLNVGSPVQAGGFVQSNSANLFQLIRSGFAEVSTLNDPANPHAPTNGEVTPQHHDWQDPRQISFSYQNQFGPSPVRIDRSPKLVVLATRNPMLVFDPATQRLRYEPNIPATTASRLHEGRGQHVLFADGNVRWTLRPVITYANGREDAIYAAHGQSTYTGREIPANQEDSFLVP